MNKMNAIITPSLVLIITYQLAVWLSLSVLEGEVGAAVVAVVVAVEAAVVVVVVAVEAAVVVVVVVLVAVEGVVVVVVVVVSVEVVERVVLLQFRSHHSNLRLVGLVVLQD